MATKKQAGTERPYTWYEFLRIVRNIVEEQQIVMHDELDYFDADWQQQNKPIDLGVWDWWLTSRTDFGGSEGVYSDFYVRMDGGESRHVFTAKTLDGSREAYVKMHEFAARVCLVVRDYVKEHEDEFNWTGYDVGYWENEERTTYMLAHKHENAMKYALELKQKGRRAWIRDNEKREYQEV